MDERTKEYTLDDLEDIIREYSSRLPKKETVRDAMHDTVRMGSDTVRLGGDTVPLGGDTVSLNGGRPVGRSAFETTRTIPKTDEDVRVYQNGKAPPKKETVPPYTMGWEPQYEEPMGEYKQPIEFPESRARILQRKLEQGPQQHYEKINKSAVGHMQAKLLLNGILFLTAAITALPFFHVEGVALKMLIVGQLLIMFLSAVVGYQKLLEGVTDLLHGRFRMGSFLALTLVVCWIDGMVCIKTQNIPFGAVFSLQMLMAQWADYQKLQTHISQLDTLRKASELTAVVKNEDFYKHQCAYQETEGQPEDFMEHYREDSGAERIFCYYALALTASGAILAATIALLHSPADGVRAYAAALVAAVPASAYVCFQRPLANLEKRLHKLGTVLCGWQGVQNMDKHGYYPLEHKDLFPENHVKLNGVRFYGERNPNTVVSYVAALMKADGGALAVPFEQLRSSRNARVCKVEELTSYPGGVSGQIDGLSVIAGTLEFIEDMGVELPEVSRIPHAVYAAVNQSLCAVFAVNFTRSKSSAAGLRTLCDSNAVRPILVDCDFAMTEEFLEEKLGVRVGRMQFPDCMTRMTLAEKKPAADAPVIALVTRGGLAQRAFAVTGAAALRTSWQIGLLVHILGGIIGFVAVAVLALHGDMWLLAAYNLLLYGFVWMIPGLLVAEWTRGI